MNFEVMLTTNFHSDSASIPKCTVHGRIVFANSVRDPHAIGYSNFAKRGLVEVYTFTLFSLTETDQE